MIKRTTFTATVNSNLAIRIPASARRKLDIGEGDLVDIEIVMIEKRVPEKQA